MTPLREHADYPELAVLVTDVLAQARDPGEPPLSPEAIAALRAGELDVDRVWVEYRENGSTAGLLGQLGTGEWCWLAAIYDEDDDLDEAVWIVRPERSAVTGLLPTTWLGRFEIAGRA